MIAGDVKCNMSYLDNYKTLVTLNLPLYSTTFIDRISRRIQCRAWERQYLSFIDPERRVFGEIFPEVMIFPEGFSPREISSLQEIFRRIPRAEGL